MPALPTMLSLFFAAAVLTACATPTALPIGQPKAVKGLDIHAYAMHEECLHLDVGDRLDYEFTSNQPLKFNIHYHEGNAVLMPIARDDAVQDSGLFAPVIAQDYCLMWEAGAAGALLDYRVTLRRAAKGS
jgi:hypothetical protein